MKKFNFQKACAAMLAELGATEPGRWSGSITLKTIAGDLWCTPYDNWLACQFDDHRAASQTIGFGQYNPPDRINGKWNWHYDQPTQRELDDLREELQSILPIMGTRSSICKPPRIDHGH